MRQPTASELEIAFGLSANTLSITFDTEYSLSPPLTEIQERQALKLLAGVPDDWIPSAPGDWDGFVSEFVDPTSSSYDQVYNATATKAQASTALTKEHWDNLRIGLSSNRFNETTFQNSAEYLNQLLIADGNPLTQQTKDAWIALAASYNITLVLS